MPTNPDWIAEAAKEYVASLEASIKDIAVFPGGVAGFRAHLEKMFIEHVQSCMPPSPSVAGELVSDERAEVIEDESFVPSKTHREQEQINAIRQLLRDRAARKAREYARRWRKVSEEKPPDDGNDVEAFRESAFHSTCTREGSKWRIHSEMFAYAPMLPDDQWRPLDPPAASTLGGLEGA